MDKESLIKNILIPLFIAITVFAVFYPSLRGEFLNWDDDRYLLNNQNYRGLSEENLRWIFFDSYENIGMYIPVTWLSWSLDYLFWGMNPYGYRLTNIIIHSLSAAALYLLAYRLLNFGFIDRVDGRTLKYGALISALVWALHPLRVESVVWITERKDVLVGFFYIMAILGYLKYIEKKGTGFGLRWYMTSVVLFNFALLSKPIAVSLTAVILILDVYPLKRIGINSGLLTGSTLKIYLEKIPFLFLSAAVSVITVLNYKNLPDRLSPFAELNFIDRLILLNHNIIFYVRKMIRPLELSPLYELWPHIDKIRNGAVLYFVLVIIISVILFLTRKKLPALTAVIIFFIATILPVSGIFQVGPQMAADRFTYIPSMGFSLLIGIMVYYLLNKYSERESKKITVMFTSLLIVFVGTLIFLSSNQIKIWKNSKTFWNHAIAMDSKSALARNFLGQAFLEDGDYYSAIENFTAEIELTGGNIMAYFKLANLLVKQGRNEESIKYYKAAIDIDPNYEPAYINLGVAIFRSGDVHGAISYYERSLSEHGDFEIVRQNLEKIRQGVGVF